MMKRMVFLLAVLGTLLSGCEAPAPGGSASSAPQEGSSAQEEQPNTEEENSVPLEEDSEPEPPSRRDSIPFTGDQLYAAAYLGFEEMEDLSYYTQRYLDSGDLPIHYFSPGEYYLIIPRYPDMSLALYKNDIQTDQSALVYEDPVCEPFLIQCNISDIFSDVTVELAYQGETVSFSVETAFPSSAMPCLSMYRLLSALISMSTSPSMLPEYGLPFSSASTRRLSPVWSSRRAKLPCPFLSTLNLALSTARSASLSLSFHPGYGVMEADSSLAFWMSAFSNERRRSLSNVCSDFIAA